MAYDAARKQVVLFGGLDARTGAPLDDTWTWNGTTWTQQTPAVRPRARARHSMTYDHVRGRVLLYGPEETGKEVWAWDGENWAVAATAPVASMPGYPVQAGATITFTGELVLHRSMGDLWTWNGSEWRTLPAPDGTYRPFASLVYVNESAKLLLFGGAQSTFLNDTWLWDGTAWQRAEPEAIPRARNLPGFAYDSRRGVAILFGGNVAANGWAPVAPSEDTWEWNGSTWAPVATGNTPPPTVGPALAYHAERDEVVLFGGYGAEDSWTGTWVLTAGTVPKAESFFDGFQNLARWSAAGGDQGACTAARGPQNNIFCSTSDFLQVAGGMVTLRGRVKNRVRRGSEIKLRSPLPAQGTFAARLRVSGPDEGTWGNASIKAFFTYTPHTSGANPCSHMEHDFEVLTGSSTLYSKWSLEVPALVNTTHAHEGGTGCPPDSPVSRTPLGSLGAQDQFLTFVVTVRCLAEPCTGAEAPYEARYFAGRDDGQFLETAVTHTTHRLLDDAIYPMFNLWWLDPGSLRNKIARSTTADQVMEVDWFLWSRATLSFEDAHRRGMACDAAGGCQ